jgi:lauroyl/myristoyl acyltransferase
MLPRLPVYLNRVLEFLPDCLEHPKWRARCPIEGIDPVRQALTERRRVLLAFPHFSLYGQLRGWLRAAGLPVACYTGGESSVRSQLKRHKDRWALFPEVPTVFHSDQLADALKFVLAGGPLLIALDGRRGRQLELPVYDGWTFRMPTGPLRIAARHDAMIFPCTLIDEGRWRFRIEIGDPVPAGLLTEETEAEAAAHLFRQVLPHLERHPEQCRPQLLDRFRPSRSSEESGAEES